MTDLLPYDVDSDHTLARYRNRKGVWVMPMSDVRKAVAQARDSGRKENAAAVRKLLRWIAGLDSIPAGTTVALRDKMMDILYPPPE